jgi:Zn-dependent peptidase ImmA (M78 family)
MRNVYPFLEKKAEDFRQRWGYGIDKPINFQSLLLELNVPTFFKPMKKVSGMAFKSESDAKFILINSNQTIGRQNFTICHELYHLFVQKDFEYKVCITQKFDKKDLEEYSADIFASFLLLPSKGIRYLIPEDELEKDSISLDTIVKIEQAFQCSRQALLYRLKKLSFLSDTKAMEYTQWVTNSAYTRGYPTHLYKATNSNDVWGDYGESALELFQSRKISEGDYASLMIEIGVDVFAEPTDDVFDF